MLIGKHYLKAAQQQRAIFENRFLGKVKYNPKEDENLYTSSKITPKKENNLEKESKK